MLAAVRYRVVSLGVSLVLVSPPQQSCGIMAWVLPRWREREFELGLYACQVLQPAGVQHVLVAVHGQG